MKFILLNGPPRSGKDTLAHMLKDHIGAHRAAVMQFSEPLKAAVHAMHGMPADTPTKVFDDVKHLPQDALGGKVPREEYVAWWNRICEHYGDEHFGKVLLCKAGLSGKDYIIVSDCGRRGEPMPLIRTVGPENVLLVQLYRGGTDFGNDGRDYVDLRDMDVLVWHAWNLRDDVDYMFEGVLKGMYWAFGEEFR